MRDARAAWCYAPTPIGRLRLVGDEEGLREIAFPDRGGSPRRGEGPPDETPFREVVRQLEAYFAGSLRAFDLPLAPAGTSFQKKVWSLLRSIPYGRTVSYGELAQRLGNPGAARAVGAANGRNPIPIVIPCHRVIGANGSMTGFGGGIEIKRRLLSLEAGQREVGLFAADPERLARL